MLISPADICLEFAPFRVCFEEDGYGYGHAVQDHEVQIMAYVGVTHEDGWLRVGRMKLTRLNMLMALAEGVSLQDACDAYSQELDEFSSTLFLSDTWEFKKFVRNALGDDGVASCCPLLYVREIEIEPAYRGKNLGLAAIHTLTHLTPFGAGTVFLNARPARTSLKGKTEKEIAKAHVRLRKHYSQLGFVRIGRTPYMGVNLRYSPIPFPSTLAK